MKKNFAILFASVNRDSACVEFSTFAIPLY